MAGDSGMAGKVALLLWAWLVLQVPARALLEGDTVTLRCRGWQNKPVTSVSFYRDGKELGTLQDGTELSLSPLQLNHSGRYHCRGLGDILEYRWVQSALVTVTVQVPVANATITPGPPALPVTPLLEVTPQGTTGHLWNTALRKEQERPPQEPSAPPQEGAGLDPHVVGTERAGGEYRGGQGHVTHGCHPHPDEHEELPGPHGRQRGPNDSYENIL
ncbi:high affinity immunoglobulin gamma Fc receptor I-like [Catharus ustulatus]|uniref:high affinity immunoglobulin gamma Fc receptor I-like n=1 Tax=Catharus ustulatus TaxID=91951 RepID=UPI001408E98F|nr:high affinity immunoglobulin gamma Fc receptor I-like [Catharus ustulatus]